jgi:hypothetical protein
MTLSRAVVKLLIVLDGVEEVVEETDFDDYVESSFQNDESGELELEDLKWYMIEYFVHDRLSKYS